jgi:hypothetical protein
MNARQELQREFDRIGKKPVCAMIHDAWGSGDGILVLLKKGYTDQEFEQFMHDLDFDYDAGYGMQYIDGTVWFDDGTWLSRNEYDGSEWWVYLGTPKIPVDLLK